MIKTFIFIAFAFMSIYGAIGQEWKYYDSNNSPMISSAGVSILTCVDSLRIFQDSQSNIHWFNGPDWIISDPDTIAGFFNGNLKSIVSSDIDTVYFCQRNYGVTRHVRSSNSWNNLHNGIANGGAHEYFSMVRQSDTLWCTSIQNEPIVKIYPGNVELIDNMYAGVDENYLTACGVDGNNSLWVASDTGLVHKTGSQWLLHEFPWPTYYGFCNAMDFGADGTIWLAMDEGLVSFDTSSKAYFFYDTSNSGLLHDQICEDLVIDSNGDLWASLRNGSDFGLYRYDGSTWTLYDDNNSPLHGSPKYIEDDIYGNIWLSVGTRLYVFNQTSLNGPLSVPGMIEYVPSTFPNPAQDILNIETASGGYKYQITSLDGKVVRQWTNTDLNSIDVSALSSGIFILQIIENNGYTTSQKFVKR